jgi:hypothetical protein
MVRHITMRGEVIDMNRLRSINAGTPAIGNANLNARGDILGRGGVVLKTQEQIEAEWEANRLAREASVKPADIKSDSIIPAAPVRKQLEADDQFFDIAPSVDPAPQPKPTTRRKITESDK